MVAPAASVLHSITLRPKMWYAGSTPNVTSSGVMCSTTVTCSMLESRFPCVRTAAFGEPAVPLVNMYAAGADGSTSTVPADWSLANTSSRVCAPSMPWPSVAISARTPRRVSPVTCDQVVRADGSMTTTAGWTTSSSFSISGAGLVGLSGATTAPTPTAARYATTKYGVLPHISATHSPGCSPSDTNSARRAATCRRSSPYVVARPWLMSAVFSAGWPSMMRERFTAGPRRSEEKKIDDPRREDRPQEQGDGQCGRGAHAFSLVSPRDAA